MSKMNEEWLKENYPTEIPIITPKEDINVCGK